MKINFLAQAYSLHIIWEILAEEFGTSPEAMNFLHASASMWIICYKALTLSPKKWHLSHLYPEY